MKLEALYAATPSMAWLTTTLVSAMPGVQITESKELILWMVAGVLCGAATKVIFPSSDTKNSLLRQFSGSAIGGAGLTLTVFVSGVIDVNADRMLAGGWIGGLLAWALIPVLSKDGRALIAKWVREKIGGGNG